MTKTAYERDNVLTPDERTASARKCLSILAEATFQDMSRSDYNFLETHRRRALSIGYGLSERELAWLRDLVERFV